MKANKFFTQDAKQKRIEAKIDKYKDSFKDYKIKNTINALPKNQDTLDVIEKCLTEYSKDVSGDTEKEKWLNIVNSFNMVTKRD